jgi:hypothetical protein
VLLLQRPEVALAFVALVERLVERGDGAVFRFDLLLQLSDLVA